MTANARPSRGGSDRLDRTRTMTRFSSSPLPSVSVRSTALLASSSSATTLSDPPPRADVLAGALRPHRNSRSTAPAAARQWQRLQTRSQVPPLSRSSTIWVAAEARVPVVAHGSRARGRRRRMPEAPVGTTSAAASARSTASPNADRTSAGCWFRCFGDAVVGIGDEFEAMRAELRDVEPSAEGALPTAGRATVVSSSTLRSPPSTRCSTSRSAPAGWVPIAHRPVSATAGRCW